MSNFKNMFDKYGTGKGEQLSKVKKLFLRKRMFNMQNSLKVVTIGSPATQYIFDSRTNPIFDEQLFEHILHIPYMSMMSFQNNESLNIQSNYAQLHDSRNLISQILELQPDIVVIDFFADVYFGAVKLDNGDYVTNNT